MSELDRVKQILIDKEIEANSKFENKSPKKTSSQPKFNPGIIQPESIVSDTYRDTGRYAVEVEPPAIFQQQNQPLFLYEESTPLPLITERRPKNALHGLFEVHHYVKEQFCPVWCIYI